MLEGHTLSNLLLFGDLNSGSVAKGYRIDTPFLGTSSEETLNDWHDRIRVLLKNLGKEEVLHIHWRKDCDYFSALDGYGRESLKASEEVREYRQKREQHFRTRIEQKSLQRSELYIYASRGLGRRRHFLRGRKGLEKDFQKVLDENQQHLSLWQDRIRNAFGNGTRVLEQTDEDNHWLLRRILDPHTHSGIKNHILGNFDRDETVEDNCVFTTGVSFEPSTTRFFFGGYYHTVFVMKKWPKVTFPGVIFDVLNQVPGLTVTVNIFSTESQREIELEKRQLKRLMRGRMESAVDFDKDIAIEKKQQKIRDLATGNVKTFSVEFLFCLREVTAERIAAAEEKFKNAILSLDGAEILEPDLKTTAATLFFHLFPGYITADREHSLCVYAQDAFLADMLPISTTFNGFLEDAEALYDGSTRNLVGVKTFERATPQHSLLFGMTGAGKSVFMEDLLMQTMPYFEYTVILEEGLSYLNFTRSMGEEPIVFHPNFTEVLNVFDTFGLPLMPENIAFVATFVANLLGTTDDETYKLRVAQIAEYVQAVYGDKAKEWLKRHPEEIVRMKRLAYAVHCWQSEKNKENLLDAWLSFQECGGENSTFFAGIDEDTADEFCKNPDNTYLLNHVLVSGFLAEDFPRLSDLIEAMKGSPKYTHNREKIFELATRLNVWATGGAYGGMFDGYTTLDLRRKVVHFELGKIPEAMPELKSACGLLITGIVRQKIMSMPRTQRKRLIFEEVARFLNVPGGEQIVSEAYAQLRKFGCQTMAIVQQYAQFKDSRIRPILIGNSKQYFIMRQQDKSDLLDLSKDIGLSPTAQDTIQNFSLPEYQAEKERHSSVFYFNPTIRPELGGVLKHFVTACLAFCFLLLTGCQSDLTRTATTAGLAAGGGLIGNSLGKGDKWATAGGVAGGVAAAYWLEQKAAQELDKKYMAGYNAGRHQAVKQHYWMIQNLHRDGENESKKQLVPLDIPSYSQNGVQYTGGKVYLDVVP